MTSGALIRHMDLDLAAPPPPGLEPLIEALRARCGDALLAVVLYGSCRRSTRLEDGLVDLLAVLSDYRRVHGVMQSVANRLLPPNVYYLEAVPSDGIRLRSKYITITAEQFMARCRGGLDGYFWARFTQPCRLIWSRSDEIRPLLAGARADAAIHFARQAVALGNTTCGAHEFWVRALRASYLCELRPEPPAAADHLIANDPEFWARTTMLAGPHVRGLLVTAPDRVQVRLTTPRRLIGAMRWRCRRVWGKLLNLARLFKAAGTFANGVDYLAWKLERHSGVHVELTDHMRRHPRLTAWSMMLRLWRRGAFR